MMEFWMAMTVLVMILFFPILIIFAIISSNKDRHDRKLDNEVKEAYLNELKKDKAEREALKEELEKKEGGEY